MNETEIISTESKNSLRAPRSDGVEARSRLLHAAVRLFAEKGFANTSTRELAMAAGVNIASISYYFGDKAGLYRAAYIEPMGDCSVMTSVDVSSVSLEQGLRLMMTHIAAPLKLGEIVQLCTRLHFREMLEPTGLWKEEINTDIRQGQAALSQLLSFHLGLEQPDADLHRLAHSIVALPVYLFMARDILLALQPHLIETPAAIDAYIERQIGYALAMVESEKVRRRSLLAHA